MPEGLLSVLKVFNFRLGFPCGLAGNESAFNSGRPGFDPWVGKIPWRRERLPSPAVIACRLLDHSQSDWREMVPHSGFDLHFSDNE